MINLQVLTQLSYGMYIICAKNSDKFTGQIANTVFQVSASPQIIAVSIAKRNLTYEYIQASKQFTVSVLERDTPLSFIGLFGFKSSRETNKFNNTKYIFGITSIPIILDYCIGYLEIEVLDSLDVGSHTIFTGKIVNAKIINDKVPLTYQYYKQVKHGTAPKSAPTYSPTAVEKEMTGMDKYVCEVCGYVYDPQFGDPDGNINPGTLFTDLPATWVCPVCGAGKDQFKKV